MSLQFNEKSRVVEALMS